MNVCFFVGGLVSVKLLCSVTGIISSLLISYCQLCPQWLNEQENRRVMTSSERMMLLPSVSHGASEVQTSFCRHLLCGCSLFYWMQRRVWNLPSTALNAERRKDTRSKGVRSWKGAEQPWVAVTVGADPSVLPPAPGPSLKTESRKIFFHL